MKPSTAVTVAGVTVATSVLAYAVYFDYKRRNDITFRKKLRESHLASVENMFSPPLIRTRHYRQGQEKGREEHGAVGSGRCYSLSTYHRAAAYGIARHSKGAASSISTRKGGVLYDPGQFG
jgi:hypothetical protein